MPKAKKTAAKKPKLTAKRKPKSTAPAKPVAPDLREEFVRLVMRIGTQEARLLLERVEDVQMGWNKP